MCCFRYENNFICICGWMQNRPSCTAQFFSTFSPIVTLSPPLPCFSPSVVPLSVWVCLGPAGEALSVNTGAWTGPWGPDTWMPTLWEAFFLFTPLSLQECLSSEVRNPHTCTQAHTHQTLRTIWMSHAVMKSQCFVCELSHPGLTSWEPFSFISPCQALPLIKDHWVQ